MARKLVLVSFQGCDKVFETIYDEVEVASSTTKFDKDTTVLFEGGTDVNPVLYGEKRNSFTGTPDRERDAYESAIFHKASKAGASFIGICRGAQFLTVLNGGKLIQDVTGHGTNHEILCVGGHNFWVTSTHHQMCNPGASLDPNRDFLVIGWSKTPKSVRYVGSDDVPVVPPEVEPEIIWYPRTRSLAIQGHPEYLDAVSTFPRYSRFLVSKFIFNQANLFFS